MTSTPRRLAIGLLAVAACLGTACSSTASTAPTTTAAPVATTTTIPGSETPAQTKAAALRAHETTLTTANIYLTSVATSAVVHGSDPSPALAAVEANSTELAAAFSEQESAAVAAQFESLWNEQAGLFLDYARAKAAGDTAAATKATDGLVAWRAKFEVFLVKTNIYLLVGTSSTPGIEPNLGDTVTAVTGVIDAQAAKSVTQYDKLVTAAGLPAFLATQLAAAQAKKFPAAYPGTATGTASNLRASLTGAFVSHAYLVGVATATVIGGGDVDPASASVATNTEQLTNAVGAIYGDASGRRFRDLWNSYNGFFISYARAAAAGDAAAQAQAKALLDSFAPTFAALWTQANPKLTSAQVTATIQADTDAQVAVIDAQVARSTTQFDLLRQTGTIASKTAEVLSEGIAEQFPQKYLP